ncbi:zinc-binding dehydrogenase [Methanoculleus chikugoensis]|uniref:zinc-binding dehydrogenase n=1 Tax=Methanoculleus chikugoensis TaxID=118126 RepID=UPI001FB4BC95|nr:zinc-binding dehydrogenase [Methanoculleus chikugoensis]
MRCMPNTSRFQRISASGSPDGVGFREAAFTTVGAIAMHGARNANVAVGENVAVIGLGLIGLLTVQILKAAGCRVIGIDIDPPEKLALAADLGADVVSNYDGLFERVRAFSPFGGADAVIITAATKSSAPIEPPAAWSGTGGAGSWSSGTSA